MAERHELHLPDEEATLALGHALGAAAPAGTLVTLSGDLGAGKTTLARGLAAGLGVPEGVSSPTYTLMQLHEGGRLPLAHFDAWMEGREKAFLADGADELLEMDGVTVVEWAERVDDWLAEGRLRVVLSHAPGGTRRAVLTSTDAAHRGLLDAVLGALGASGEPS